MSYSLRDMRKDAGYKSAKLFAEAMDIPAPTYARYEQSPDKIPLKAAWALADKLGCSIDAVVGRQQVEEETVHGAVQTFYDSLKPAPKALFDEFMAFTAGKEADAAKRASAAESALYSQQAQRYEEMFVRTSAASKSGSETILFGTDKEVREAYRSFVWELLEGQRDDEMARFRDEWFDGYRNMFTPKLDLNIDSRGNIYGEDEETRRMAGDLLAKAIDNKSKKLIEKYEGVMAEMMKAYDATHPIDDGELP